MEEMIIHRGGQLVSKADLDLIKLPEATDSYVPVSHFHLAEKILTMPGSPHRLCPRRPKPRHSEARPAAFCAS
jgi:hypothetical protein